jgi:phage baseplate assembly protein W
MEEISGVAFPFRIDPATGGVQWAKNDEKIRQNVRLILSVSQGERPMLRDYGSIVQSMVQNPNDAALAKLLQKHIQEILLVWEPRIMVTSAHVKQSEAELEIHVIYRHVTDPRVDELIIPLR